MKAYRLYNQGDLRLEELPFQPVGKNCVKIKVLKSALTHADNLAYEGKLKVKYPVILGRHCVAMVSETGENVTNVVRGNRVALSPFTSCHDCEQCNQGKGENCEHKLEYGHGEDGFLRDFAVVHCDDLYKLPDRVSDSEAMFLEHIATAVNIIGKLNLEKGEHIVIAGATVTGIILAQAAIYYQAVPILLDVRQDRLDIAASLGVYYTVNTTESDAMKKIFSLTGGRMAETAAFMSAEIMPLTRAFGFCMPHGRVAICNGMNSAAGLSADLNEVVEKQLEVFGVSSMGRNMLSAINMLANKSVKVAPLISKEIAFSGIEDAFKEMEQLPDKYIKVLVDMK